MSDFATRRRMMVDTQVRPSDVTEFPIIEAMLTVPREAFVPRDRIEAAYVSEHVPLGGGRVLLDPRVFAKMLDALDISNDDLVLDVGAGLGYSAAVIARIAEAVVAVEDDDTRASEAQSLLSEHHADNVILHEGPLDAGARQRVACVRIDQRDRFQPACFGPAFGGPSRINLAESAPSPSFRNFDKLVRAYIKHV